MVDDQTLVKQAQQGSREAVAALYDAYHPPVYRYIAYRVGSRSAADDLTAEVFVKMVKHIDGYEQRGRPFLAWLYTIAGNIVKMYYRQQNKPELEPLPEEMVAPDASPADIAHSRLNQRRLLAAMPRLTEEQRAVILLKFLEGLTTAEVAAALDKNEGAVRALQHRALAALRHILQEIEEVTHGSA